MASRDVALRTVLLLVLCSTRVQFEDC